MLMTQSPEVVLTDHAIDRRKRLGLSKKSMQRQAELALDRGSHHCELKGKLKKWIDYEALSSSTGAVSKYVIYNNHLFLFQYAEQKSKILLVTMLKIPPRLLKNISNYIK